MTSLRVKQNTSCYEDYTRLKKAKYDDSYDLKEDPYDIAESVAFLELTEFCSQLIDEPRVVKFTELIDEPRVVKFTELVDLMETVMNNREQSLKASTKKKLRRKLERHIVGIELQIVDSALYVYPSTLSHNKIISEFVKVSNKLLQNTNLNVKENIILSAAHILRNEMKNTKGTIPWPPKASYYQQHKFSYYQQHSSILRNEMKNTKDTIPWPPKASYYQQHKFYEMK